MEGIFGQISWESPCEPASADTRVLTRDLARGAPWLCLGASSGVGSLFQNERVLLVFEGALTHGESSAPYIARCYAKYGEGFLQDLSGAFSLALWDEEKQKLFLARDRVGQRPLWYCKQPSSLEFSSQLTGHRPLALNPEALKLYLTWGYLPSPKSPQRGWESLPAGQQLTVSGEHPAEPAPYWDLRVPPRVARKRGSLESLSSEARALLMDSCEEPTHQGARLLVGGDNLSTALLAALPGKFPFCYVAVGPEAEREAQRARELASTLKTHGNILVYQEDGGELPKLSSLMQSTYAELDAPCGDPDLLWRSMQLELAAKDPAPIVAGLGEDFFFGLEEGFQPTAVVEGLPWVARKVLSRAVSVLPKRFFHGERVTALRQEARLGRLPLEQKLVTRLSLFGAPVSSDECGALSDYLRAPRGAKPADRLFYASIKGALPDAVLSPFEALAKAKGLAAFLPFCDVRVAEFAATLPRSMKARAILAKAFPEAPKPLAGPEALPIETWLRGPLRSLLEEMVGAPSAKISSYVPHDLAKRLFEEHQSGKVSHSRQLFALLSLELWLRKQAPQS